MNTILKCYFFFFLLSLALILSLPEYSKADCADDLEDLVGYTIVDSKTITGWRDDDEKDDSSFNGCSHGRIIYFSDGTKLTCAEYGYMYAYRPTAIIFARELSIQGKKIYDIKCNVTIKNRTKSLKRGNTLHPGGLVYNPFNKP